MAAIAKLRTVVLDCPDPRALAGFYARIIGWEITYDEDEWVTLTGPDGSRLAFQRAENHRPPKWPDPDAPQQFHLDFTIDDLDPGEKEVLAIGATKLAFQPGGESFRVFADPAGHPFCLCVD